MNVAPSDLAKGLAAIGRVIDRPRTAALYAPLHSLPPYPGVGITRDIQYGPAERNRLDIFTAEVATATARPVLLFVHGGGFVGGDKHTPGSPFHDNIGAWAARHGLVGVTMTYRLAPQDPWPAGAEDVGAAVRWARSHIGEHGGDPARIYLMGHSAGATHVSSYVAQPAFQGPDGLGLAGVILSSGLYDLTAFPLTEARYRSYFGEDKNLYAARSSLPNLGRSTVPQMIVDSELDPPLFVKQAEALRDALSRAGNPPRVVRLADHNHLSGNHSIGTADTSLSGAILDFIGKP